MRIIPNIFQDNKYNYLALLLYTVLFPLYLFFEEGLNLEFHSTLFLPEITLIMIILFFFISLKKDIKKTSSILLLIFLLSVFGYILIVETSFSPIYFGTMELFFTPIAYIPIIFFIGIILHKFVIFDRNQNSSEEKSNIYMYSKTILIVNMAIFSVGLVITQLIMGLIMHMNPIETMFVINVINFILTILGIGLSIKLWKKYKYLLVTNIIAFLIFVGMFVLILIFAMASI